MYISTESVIGAQVIEEIIISGQLSEASTINRVRALSTEECAPGDVILEMNSELYDRSDGTGDVFA